jgi:hypothetical protein
MSSGQAVSYVDLNQRPRRLDRRTAFPLLFLKVTPITDAHGSASIASQNIDKARLAEPDYSRHNEGFRAAAALASWWR